MLEGDVPNLRNGTFINPARSLLPTISLGLPLRTVCRSATGQRQVQRIVVTLDIHMVLIFPSGKQPHNYGKSPFLIGKSTINGPFSIAMLNYQRVPCKKFARKPTTQKMGFQVFPQRQWNQKKAALLVNGVSHQGWENLIFTIYQFHQISNA